MNQPAIEVFINEGIEGRSDAIALVILHPSIVPYNEDLVPGCALTSHQARELGDSLYKHAETLENPDLEEDQAA